MYAFSKAPKCQSWSFNRQSFNLPFLNKSGKGYKGVTPEKFQHQAIRDLVWLLTSPQLCHCTAESWQIPAPHWGTLVQLDSDPRPIDAWLTNKKTGLLGHYHEQLWLFYFHIHPELELLASNLIIQGKNRTLGEFDVLLRDTRDGLVWHLELAIKFYLGTESGWGQPNAWSHWLGVACQDSMEHKWQRLINQQLKLGEQPQVQQWLEQHAPAAGQSLIPDRASALTRGYLFYPTQLRQPLPSPERMNPNHLKGSWITLSQWQEHYQKETEEKWRICRKPHWMAQPIMPEWISAPDITQILIKELTAPEIADQSNLSGKKRDRRPQMGTEGLLLERRSGERLFVVSDGWPGYIPLPWHRL